MKAIATFTVVPIGAGVSLARYIAACERVLQETGLTVELHANGTNVEGEWAEVFDAIRRCHETLHQMGVPRIHTAIQVGTRTDKAQAMGEKVHRVQEELGAAGK